MEVETRLHAEPLNSFRKNRRRPDVSKWTEEQCLRLVREYEVDEEPASDNIPQLGDYREHAKDCFGYALPPVKQWYLVDDLLLFSMLIQLGQTTMTCKLGNYWGCSAANEQDRQAILQDVTALLRQVRTA